MDAQIPRPIFHGLVYGSMLIANDEIGALADRVALELPRIVERVRLLDRAAVVAVLDREIDRRIKEAA